jgi:negative regulator of flagellin synthesis FlgM
MSYANGIGSLQQALSVITPTETKPALASGAKNETSIQTAGSADQTDLSTVGGLIAQALGVSDTRSAKVVALQQAIASGSYNVSSSDVADKMIQSLLG